MSRPYLLPSTALKNNCYVGLRLLDLTRQSVLFPAFLPFRNNWQQEQEPSLGDSAEVTRDLQFCRRLLTIGSLPQSPWPAVRLQLSQPLWSCLVVKTDKGKGHLMESWKQDPKPCTCCFSLPNVNSFIAIYF